MKTLTTHCHKVVSSEGFTLIAEIGEWGELKAGSFYFKKRPLVSFSGDMTRVGEFDGLFVVNTQRDLSQFLGLVVHGDITPLNWQKLLNNLLGVIHKAVGKGTSHRLAVPFLRVIENGVTAGQEKGELKVQSDSSVLMTHYFKDDRMGKDTAFYEQQAKDLIEYMAKNLLEVKFITKAKLVGRTIIPPFFPMPS